MADLSSYALKSEDSPFQLFLNDINGLRSFQPTLLWKIDFTRYSKDFPNNQKVIFTDSITVPGEKISTSVAETFVGDLPYPINDRRSTTNTLSIGFFVDIYGTLEKRIVDDIKFIAKHGIKEGIKQQINLYGYRMGSNDYNPRKPEFTRPCYIHYSFEKCVPVSMDEFTYDHKNDKWGRTRNVTFAFTEYRIETDGQSLSENTKKLNDVEFGRVVNGVPDVISGLKERKTSDGSIVWKGVRTSNQLGFDKKKKDFTKSDFYVDTDTKAHKDKIDFNAFIRELYEASERASNGNVLTYVPNSETDIPVGTGTSAPVAGGTNRNGYVYLYKHPGYKWADGRPMG